jgi:hypothetical protein
MAWSGGRLSSSTWQAFGECANSGRTCEPYTGRALRENLAT